MAEPVRIPLMPRRKYDPPAGFFWCGDRARFCSAYLCLCGSCDLMICGACSDYIDMTTGRSLT